jgi:signal transduction histidine kinase
VLPLFALCAAALVGVMAWLTLTVRRLEDAERRSRDEAALEETVRLALWRMESQLAPLVAQESSHPYYLYRRSFPARLVATLPSNRPELANVPIVSPLAAPSSPYVRLHFQWDGQGRLSSPQLPEPDRDEDSNRRARESLAAAGHLTDRSKLLASLSSEWIQVEPSSVITPGSSRQPAASPAQVAAVSAELSQRKLRESEHEARIAAAPVELSQQRESQQKARPAADLEVQKQALRQQQAVEAQRQAEAQHRAEAKQQAAMQQKPEAQQQAVGTAEQAALQQKTLSKMEYYARAASNFANVNVQSSSPPRRSPPSYGTTEVRVGRLQPVWIADELLLARRVRVGTQELVQVCWLDWPAMRRWLLAAVSDLLPAAQLVPVAAGDEDETRRLAALPVRLLPGAVAPALASSSSGLGLPLAAAWVLAFVSLAASAALLFGMATLSERRAAFVSAVTHELRTPLTTFRIYSDMLLEGMVQSEEQRRQYLATLSREAERQSHLVENVLAYSRLERGRYAASRESVTVEDLLASVSRSLVAHAEQSGMSLLVSIPAAVAAVTVRVDRSAVERILFNLVDNACKYGRDAADRRIHLDCESDARALRLTISDHGPGIDAREASRLFRPFHKSARDAAQSAPGVGLGLALSRRLAQAIGGDLRAVRTGSGGAAFCLRLPRQDGRT